MSTTTHTLIEEIKTAPESVQREVFDFLIFLKARQNTQAEDAEGLLLRRASSRCRIVS